MVVVEGPDGSGKTTLCKWIAEEFDLEYRRAPTLSSSHGPDDAAVQWFEEEINDGGDGGVYDRVFAISEPIYQLATPGRPLLRDAAYMKLALNRTLFTVDLLIICLPPWEVARQNLEDIGRLQLKGVDRLALEKIHWAYAYQYVLFRSVLGPHATTYDYTSMTTDHVEEAIHDLGIA